MAASICRPERRFDDPQSGGSLQQGSGLNSTAEPVLRVTPVTVPKAMKPQNAQVSIERVVIHPAASWQDWKEKPQVEAHSIHKSSFSGDSLASSWSDNGTMVHGVHDKPWYIIDPESSWYASGWQMIVGVALVFVAFLTPLQIGLFDIRFDSMLLVSLAVDFIFLVDLILQFFVMISVSTFHGLKREVRLSRVGLKYLKTWFFIDALAVVPWDLIGAVRSDEILRLGSSGSGFSPRAWPHAYTARSRHSFKRGPAWPTAAGAGAAGGVVSLMLRWRRSWWLAVVVVLVLRGGGVVLVRWRVGWLVVGVGLGGGGGGGGGAH